MKEDFAILIAITIAVLAVFAIGLGAGGRASDREWRQAILENRVAITTNAVTNITLNVEKK